MAVDFAERDVRHAPSEAQMLAAFARSVIR
jgi:hypothetical protein